MSLDTFFKLLKRINSSINSPNFTNYFKGTIEGVINGILEPIQQNLLQKYKQELDALANSPVLQTLEQFNHLLDEIILRAKQQFLKEAEESIQKKENESFVLKNSTSHFNVTLNSHSSNAKTTFLHRQKLDAEEKKRVAAEKLAAENAEQAKAAQDRLQQINKETDQKMKDQLIAINEEMKKKEEESKKIHAEAKEQQESVLAVLQEELRKRGEQMEILKKALANVEEKRNEHTLKVKQTKDQILKDQADKQKEILDYLKKEREQPPPAQVKQEPLPGNICCYCRSSKELTRCTTRNCKYALCNSCRPKFNCTTCKDSVHCNQHIHLCPHCKTLSCKRDFSKGCHRKTCPGRNKPKKQKVAGRRRK